MKLTIAVPSKGRISDPAVNILEKAENCSLPLTTRT